MFLPSPHIFFDQFSSDVVVSTLVLVVLSLPSSFQVFLYVGMLSPPALLADAEIMMLGPDVTS